MKMKIFIVVIVIALAILILGESTVRYVISRKTPVVSKKLDLSVRTDDGIALQAVSSEPEKESHNWVILIHSYGSDHTIMRPYMNWYQSQGYHVIAPDNRAHGSSEGKFIGMGYLDQFDIRQWIDYVLEQDSNAEIILHGVSMGGAALMMLSAQEDLPDNITAVIEDCGYKSARDYLTWKLKQRFHLPAFPLIQIANLAFKMHAGYWMNDASAIEAVKKSKIPTLFIHGTEDQTVPLADVYDLYEAATCKKDLYVVEGAGHGEALEADPAMYWEKVQKFIEECK